MIPRNTRRRWSTAAILAVALAVLIPAMRGAAGPSPWGTYHWASAVPPGVDSDEILPDVPMSRDGRYVVLSTFVPYDAGDTNGMPDVYVRDVQTGLVELISVAQGGGAGDSQSFLGSISADGRYVVFISVASDLVSGAAPGWQVYLRDRVQGTTERVSVNDAGNPANSFCFCYPGVSADGRYVVFASGANNLASVAVTPGRQHVYLRDLQLGTTRLVSIGDDGREADNFSHEISAAVYSGIPLRVSDDGRYVMWDSYASNVAVGWHSGWGVYLRDMTQTVNANALVGTAGWLPRGWTAAAGGVPRVLIGLGSTAILYDPAADSSFEVSLLPDNTSVGDSAESLLWAQGMSADGRFCAFQTVQVDGGAGLATFRTYLRDLALGVTEQVDQWELPSTPNIWSSSYIPLQVALGGRYLGYSTAAPLDANDENGLIDAYVLERPRAAIAVPTLSGVRSTGRRTVLYWNDPYTSEEGFHIYHWNGTEFELRQSEDADITSAMVRNPLKDRNIYFIRAYSGSALGPPSNKVTVIWEPADPTGLTATGVSSTRIRLQWQDNSTTETGFRVERETGDDEWELLATVGAGKTLYNHDGLTPGVTHTYRVVAVNATEGLQSEASNAATGSTLPLLPLTPLALTASVGPGLNTVQLVWNTIETDDRPVTGYRVWRSVDGGAYALRATRGAWPPSYEDTGLTLGVKYTYYVTAYNAAGNSPGSNKVSVKPMPELPAAPSELTATPGGPTVIRLEWTDNSTAPHQATGFRVYRSSAGGAYELVATLGAVTAYEDGGRTPGVRYTYYVAGFNLRGPSRSSNKASLTLPSL